MNRRFTDEVVVPRTTVSSSYWNNYSTSYPLSKYWLLFIYLGDMKDVIHQEITISYNLFTTRSIQFPIRLHGSLLCDTDSAYFAYQDSNTVCMYNQTSYDLYFYVRGMKLTA